MRLLSRDVAGASRAAIAEALEAQGTRAVALAVTAVALAVLEVAREVGELRREQRKGSA